MEFYELLKFENELKINIENNDNVYITGIDFISELLAKNEFPIANKRIAIKNILSFLQWVELELKKNTGTIIKINQETFISFFNSRKYKAYEKLLDEMNVLTCVPIPGKKYYYNKENKECKNYRIHNSFIKQDLALFIIKECNNLEIELDSKGYNRKLVNTIRNVDIDIKKAFKEECENIKSDKSLRYRLTALFSLYNRRFIKKGNKVNRVYHSLSNLSKISRKHLNIKGKEFNNIDIKNCQPLLLCYYMAKNELSYDLNYKNDCENGVVYENFITETRDRNEVKELLYKNIYFKLNEDKEIAKQFASIYPKTYESLVKISLGEQTLASILQNLEAEIFNSLVPDNSKFYFTLFDAIYFTDGNDILPLKKEIESKFGVYGLKAKVEING